MNIYDTKIRNCIPSSIFTKYYYRKVMGKKLNLKNPKTFNEKLNWLKLHYRNSIMPSLVDKYQVRDYIKKKIGKEYLIPLVEAYIKKFDKNNKTLYTINAKNLII